MYVSHQMKPASCINIQMSESGSTWSKHVHFKFISHLWSMNVKQKR